MASVALVPANDGSLVLYSAMVTAIAECARVDEIKDIRDKAMALEMYHRQAQNFEAEREAANVRLRAERRAGELLKDLARAPESKGGDLRSVSRRETPIEPSPYAQALEENGISRQKAHRYQRLAEVPAQVFEDALAGPEKPTAVRVAAYAQVRAAADPVPEVASNALWLWGRLRDFDKMGFFKIDGAGLLAGMPAVMASDVRQLAPRVAEFLTSLENDNEPA